MKEKDFLKMLEDGVNNIKSINEVKSIENGEIVSSIEKLILQDKENWVFRYASACEVFFEKMTRFEYERKTTFSSDFSIAEAYSHSEGTEPVFDTFIRAVKEWKNNIEFFAEIILAMNIKSWEMYSRGLKGWSILYSYLYNLSKDLYLSWFDGNEKAIEYYYENVD